jgi:23S rRNA (adenine2503-C2)-methyltransferase
MVPGAGENGHNTRIGERRGQNDLYRLLPEELDELVEGLGGAAYRPKQLLDGLYRSRATSIDEIATLPAAFRRRLAAAGWGAGVRDVRALQRSLDGSTTKALLALPSGALIESVLMQYPTAGKRPRSTVCVSTQAGCAMA